MILESLIVTVGIIGILLVLFFDWMRPGFTLLCGAILFMATGVITPDELLEGFSNREMITIAMLFLVGEGVRQAGALKHLMKIILPKGTGRVGWLLLKMLPFITSLSMILNNTAVVIIFAPIVKRWAERIGISATKFLIPLSYATILGGMCTLIGTSTNMVVNGLMTKAGYRGFNMFELGKVGGIIAVVGLIYICIFANRLLPDAAGRRRRRQDPTSADEEEIVVPERGKEWTVEVLLMSRFPGMGRRVSEFDFLRHYGARIVSIKRNGVEITHPIQQHVMGSGDTLRLATDEGFVRTWRDSSAFYILSDVDEEDEPPLTPMLKFRRWIGLALVLMMVVGATLGDKMSEFSNGVRIDMFMLSSVVVVTMALLRLFPAKRYTKYITWDILIAIAAAFAISRAMSNSGMNEIIANAILSFPHGFGPYGILALLFIVTMLFSEIITNSAAVAICFPVAQALSQQMGINPMPLFVAICMAASSSFSSPIGYQTNLIVQGVGGYKFKDYIRIGIWLNIISLTISVTLIPRIWSFY
ncbi:MAG: SLC13 family permease [Rikenellaceae bacterium]